MEKVNSVSFGLLNYLESRLGEKVSGEVRRGGVLTEWSSSYPLPEDMASFYKETDGVDVSWTHGAVRLRRLRDIEEVPLDDLPDAAAALCVEGSSLVGRVSCDEIVLFGFLFNSDVHCRRDATTYSTFLRLPLLQVCLVYKSHDDFTPKIYFQDLACRWHFVTTTLTNYFRLQVVHLGIIGWQYAYTDIGLDPIARQYLAFYCPERLHADDNHLLVAGADNKSVKTHRLHPGISPRDQLLYT